MAQIFILCVAFTILSVSKVLYNIYCVPITCVTVGYKHGCKYYIMYTSKAINYNTWLSNNKDGTYTTEPKWYKLYECKYHLKTNKLTCKYGMFRKELHIDK